MTTILRLRIHIAHSLYDRKIIMKNKNLIKVIIGIFSLLPILVSGQETPPPYIVLVSGDNINGETNIEIPEGYLVEFVSLDLVTGTEQPGTPGESHTFSRMEIHGNQNQYHFQICYTSESTPNALPKISRSSADFYSR